MNDVQIIDRLGPDTELLTKSDGWLSSQQLKVCQQISILIADLRIILMAQKIKSELQQTNRVAVRNVVRIDTEFDEVIHIMPLPDAIQTIAADDPQLNIWSVDGYDVPTASALRA